MRRGGVPVYHPRDRASGRWQRFPLCAGRAGAPQASAAAGRSFQVSTRPWVQHQLPWLFYPSNPEAAPNGSPRRSYSVDIRQENFIWAGSCGPPAQIREKGAPQGLSFNLSQGKTGGETRLDPELPAHLQKPRQLALARSGLCCQRLGQLALIVAQAAFQHSLNLCLPSVAQ